VKHGYFIRFFVDSFFQLLGVSVMSIVLASYTVDLSRKTVFISTVWNNPLVLVSVLVSAAFFLNINVNK
jgi:cell shape-determining protein MreD